jgi:AcrR family transcriptional regulator
MPVPSRGETAPNPEDDLLRATYRALCKHGHANLTISAIGSEYSKSQSNIYDRYETKDELVADCLDMLLTSAESEFDSYLASDGGDSVTHFEKALDWLIRERSADERELASVLLQLRAHARHDNRLQDRFAASERLFHKYLSRIIQQEIEDEASQSGYSDGTAAFILTTPIGILTQQVTTDHEIHPPIVQAELDRYLKRSSSK